jgi:DNA-directed RNA polymerase specialized sigma24 family protein
MTRLPRSPEEETVSDDEATADLLRRIRQGDGAAAAELVRLYEPEIRRSIHVRLTDPRLRRVLDSLDVCQSVLAAFFVRAAAGQYDLHDPGRLLRLLTAMARNKVLDHARRQQARRRDQRRVEAGAAEVLEGVADPAPTPGRVAAGRDLLEEVRRRLSDEERRLADQRALGRDWAAIAAAEGVAPDALRKKLTRALDRVARELGLEDADDA